jgi:hypothetical protein
VSIAYVTFIHEQAGGSLVKYHYHNIPPYLSRNKRCLSMRKEVVLITGANGEIGHGLISYLAEQN